MEKTTPYHKVPLKDNNPQPEQVEALLSRLRVVAEGMTRIQLGKLLKVTDQQLRDRLTRNIRAVETPPVDPATSGITSVSIRGGDREYLLIQYWESGKTSFTTNELLAKARELEAEGVKDDIDWFQNNEDKIGKNLPEQRNVLVFTGFQNRGRRTVPYLAYAFWSASFRILSYKGDTGLWRLDHTWFVKRIK